MDITTQEDPQYTVLLKTSDTTNIPSSVIDSFIHNSTTAEHINPSKWIYHDAKV